MVGKKHQLARPTACISVANSTTSIGLDKRLSSTMVANVTLPMQIWHMLALCWHTSLGNTSMGLCMVGRNHWGWQIATIGLGIRLCNGGKLDGLTSKVHMNIRMCIKHRLASRMQLQFRLCMVGREKRLATPTWQIAPMGLGIRLCSGGNMHGLASKVHFNIRLSMTGRKQWLASKLHLTLRLCMTGKLHGGLASHLWLVTTMGTVGRKE